MANKNYPTVTYVDTTYVPTEEDYKESKEWLGDVTYDEYVEDVRDLEIDDLFLNLKHSKYSDEICVITGTLGRWNGNKEIYPVVVENVETAIKKCFGSCDDVKVTLENGLINVIGYHHDGTNNFVIHRLSKCGKKRFIAGDTIYFNEMKDYHMAKFKGYLV